MLPLGAQTRNLHFHSCLCPWLCVCLCCGIVRRPMCKWGPRRSTYMWANIGASGVPFIHMDVYGTSKKPMCIWGSWKVLVHVGGHVTSVYVWGISEQHRCSCGPCSIFLGLRLGTSLTSTLGDSSTHRTAMRYLACSPNAGNWSKFPLVSGPQILPCYILGGFASTQAYLSGSSWMGLVSLSQ